MQDETEVQREIKRDKSDGTESLENEERHKYKSGRGVRQGVKTDRKGLKVWVMHGLYWDVKGLVHTQGNKSTHTVYNLPCIYYKHQQIM